MNKSFQERIGRVTEGEIIASRHSDTLALSRPLHIMISSKVIKDELIDQTGDVLRSEWTSKGEESTENQVSL